MIVDYGTKQAKLTDLIAENQADIALANGLAAGAATLVEAGLGNIWGKGGTIAAIHSANAVYQHHKQQQIGKKQAKIVNLQVEQQAEFTFLDKEINDVKLEAQIKIWFLDLRKYEIQMIDAELILGQELARLAQYYTEIQGKVMRRDRALKDMTRRSFADPTYRIEVLNSALKAEDSFQAAQKWVYLAAKALEYKWPIGNDVSGLNTVTIPAIVRARLTDSSVTTANLLNYMEVLENIDTTYSLSIGTQLYYWNYSLRKDYLGMTFDKQIPGSGQVLSPVMQFQQFLVDLRGQKQNLIDLSGDGIPDHLAIPFSTVRFAIQDDDTGSYILTDSQGNLQQLGVDGRPIFDSRLWDDKIDWIQVNIIGNNVYSDPQLMPIELWYGGSGFIRYSEPVGPPGEEVDFRVIPVPHFTLTPANRGFGWKGYSYLKEGLSAKLVTNPREVPSEVYRTINLREHPVAATDWRILIPLNGTNLENIRDIEIIIVRRARTRQ
jgi:hypothetical protein